MNNAFGEAQHIVLLGGTSDIGLAIVGELISPATRVVSLGCRDVGTGEALAVALRSRGPAVEVVHFDACAPDTHQSIIDAMVARHGDIDVAIFAFGVLGEQQQFDADPSAAARAVTTNYVGAVSSGLAVANVIRRQGHGALIFMSSVAGERVRSANFVYGSSKAGLDGFAQGLADALAPLGGRVLVVRPGFVHSAMTAGMKAVPFSTTPDVVARQTVKALKAGRHTVWVPGVLRLVFGVFRHLPRPLWRRLPLG
jgi:decaprenylphospho-beta-D-erythro-pentofuranosid-2-ulose 2-reductase